MSRGREAPSDWSFGQRSLVVTVLMPECSFVSARGGFPEYVLLAAGATHSVRARQVTIEPGCESE